MFVDGTASTSTMTIEYESDRLEKSRFIPFLLMFLFISRVFIILFLFLRQTTELNDVEQVFE